MTRFFLAAGALIAGLAVAFGAFGAHTLGTRVTADRLAVFETGVRYQMYHGLALLFLAWAAQQWPSWQITTAGYLFLAGVVIFSGSLYLLVLTDTPWLGAVTPLGGLSFMIGWALLFWAAIAQ